MKCILVGPVYPYRGGIAHYTSLLARILEMRGSNIRIVSFRRQYPRWLYPGKSDRDPSRNPYRVKADYLLDPLYPWTWWKSARKIARWHPDIVIFQWWVTFWAPAFLVVASLLRHNGIKILYIIHNVMPHEHRPWDVWLAGLALRQGNRFIVQSEREKARLLSLLPSADVIMEPLPPFTMFSDQSFSTLEAKKKLGLTTERPLALFFGIVRPYKGLSIALKGLAELNSRGHPIDLMVAGEFWEDLPSYTHLIKELGLTGQIHIENRYIPDEEVGLYFSAADIFVAPYIAGTQSAAVKVAMSFNLPVVISKAIASTELETGSNYPFYWCIPGDFVGMANAIENALQRDKANFMRMTPTAALGGWEKLAGKIESLV